MLTTADGLSYETYHQEQLARATARFAEHKIVSFDGDHWLLQRVKSADGPTEIRVLECGRLLVHGDRVDPVLFAECQDGRPQRVVRWIGEASGIEYVAEKATIGFGDDALVETTRDDVALYSLRTEIMERHTAIEATCEDSSVLELEALATKHVNDAALHALCTRYASIAQSLNYPLPDNPQHVPTDRLRAQLFMLGHALRVNWTQTRALTHPAVVACCEAIEMLKRGVSTLVVRQYLRDSLHDAEDPFFDEASIRLLGRVVTPRVYVAHAALRRLVALWGASL